MGQTLASGSRPTKASKEDVWNACFSTAEDWAKWDPGATIGDVEGGVEAGGKFSLTGKGGDYMKWTFVEVDRYENMVLNGDSGMPCGCMTSRWQIKTIENVVPEAKVAEGHQEPIGKGGGTGTYGAVHEGTSDGVEGEGREAPPQIQMSNDPNTPANLDTAKTIIYIDVKMGGCLGRTVACCAGPLGATKGMEESFANIDRLALAKEKKGPQVAEDGKEGDEVGVGMGAEQ